VGGRLQREGLCSQQKEGEGREGLGFKGTLPMGNKDIYGKETRPVKGGKEGQWRGPSTKRQKSVGKKPDLIT